MKLLIVVVEDDDAPNLIKKLNENNFYSTKLASTGGFLFQGNTTLLIGVEDDLIEPALKIIRENCVRRKKLLPHTTTEIPTAINMPIEIEVGGATIFIVDISEFHKV